jgi:hypothetical protein
VARLFISQERIYRWVGEEKITVERDRMVLPAFGTAFRLAPAMFFVREVTGSGDPHDLLGRVKVEIQLREMGADVVAHSVLFGDSAYECELGFLAEATSDAVPDAAAGGLSERHLAELPST